ncbi:hypothetical protein K8R30_02995 [archaeon]|nr:hypothetical protein [archaeon]
MGAWKDIITTRKSSLAVGLAGSICSTNYIQQGIEKIQQDVGQISSQALLQSEKSIAKQAAAQLVQIPWGQNITKNLPDEFRSSLPSIEEIEAELSGGKESQ